MPPSGWGVRSLRPLKFLRYGLMANGHFACWTDLLQRTMRMPGRPRNKFVDDEGFERFYTVPTATTSRDRLLLALKRGYPEHFAASLRTQVLTARSWDQGGHHKRPDVLGAEAYAIPLSRRCLADQPLSLKARAVTRMATTTQPLQSLACPESATMRSTHCAGAGVLLKLHKRLPYPDR